MLVLSRKAGERIVIRNDIIIEVLERIGDKVRIGITAPPDVPIWRQELTSQGGRPKHPAKPEAPPCPPSSGT